MARHGAYSGEVWSSFWECFEVVLDCSIRFCEPRVKSVKSFLLGLGLGMRDKSEIISCPPGGHVISRSGVRSQESDPGSGVRDRIHEERFHHWVRLG